MGTALPELGSKISLISNADIRYEGHLFTVDPQQCTIALAAVRSFGTENREVMCPVPPQAQVYDYILFRGSDIKDIRILNNVSSVPNDPAIMQLSMPPHLNNKPFQPQSFGHPVMGHFGGNVYGGGDPHAQNLRTDKPSELNFLHGGAAMPTTATTLTPPVLEPTQARSHEHDLIGGGSRSTTPASCNSRKSPTADQSTQAGSKKDEKKVVKPIQPPKHHDRRDSQQEHRNNQNRQQQPRTNQQGQQQHQVYHQNNQQYQQRNYNDQQRNYNDQQRNYGGQQHNQSQRGHPQRPRTRGRPRGNPGNSYNGQQTGTGYKQPNPINAKPKIKFESEFDFEEANSQFIKMCEKLEKTKLDEPKPEVNGATTTTELEKKDDSGNETGAGETEVEEDGSASTEGFYNKSKSFFDNISCEAIERQKGRSQRTDWRQERKLNTETFGVSSARHGGYRTRGGYHPRGYRGGYRSNYRNHQGGQRNNQGGQQLLQQGGESSKNNVNTNRQLEQSQLPLQEQTSATPVPVTAVNSNIAAWFSCRKEYLHIPKLVYYPCHWQGVIEDYVSHMKNLHPENYLLLSTFKKFRWKLSGIYQTDIYALKFKKYHILYKIEYESETSIFRHTFLIINHGLIDSNCLQFTISDNIFNRTFNTSCSKNLKQSDITYQFCSKYKEAQWELKMEDVKD